jgi:DNA-binding NarL/FixJ family response regulator
MGIGTVSLPITELATAQGEAFVLSGRGFDALEKTDRRLKMHCSHIPSRIALEAISLFTDYLFRSLTIKQAAVLNHMLEHRTQFETALLLKKSQSTVNKHVRNMGWRQMEELMDLYDKCIQQIKQHG